MANIITGDNRVINHLRGIDDTLYSLKQILQDDQFLTFTGAIDSNGVVSGGWRVNIAFRQQGQELQVQGKDNQWLKIADLAQSFTLVAAGQYQIYSPWFNSSKPDGYAVGETCNFMFYNGASGEAVYTWIKCIQAMAPGSIIAPDAPTGSSYWAPAGQYPADITLVDTRWYRFGTSSDHSWFTTPVNGVSWILVGSEEDVLSQANFDAMNVATSIPRDVGPYTRIEDWPDQGMFTVLLFFTGTEYVWAWNSMPQSRVAGDGLTDQASNPLAITFRTDSSSLDARNIIKVAGSSGTDITLQQALSSITEWDVGADKSTLPSSPSSLKGATEAQVSSGLSGKVDKITGKVLSDNNYSTSDLTKLSALPTAAQLASQLSAAQSITITDGSSSLDLVPAGSQTNETVGNTLRRNVKALFSYFLNGVATSAQKLSAAKTLSTDDNVTTSASFDGSANATLGIQVTTAAPSASSTQTIAGSRSLRSQLKTLIDNIAYLFANNGITALTGDVTASGNGSVAATLASVTRNNTTESTDLDWEGNIFAIDTLTTDSKGRVTGVRTHGYTIPAKPTEIDGNAGTATKLQTARTIGIAATGTLFGAATASFDGSANITISPAITNQAGQSSTQRKVYSTGKSTSSAAPGWNALDAADVGITVATYSWS